MNKPRARHGFSLIELMCVMAIIAILAGLLLGPAGRILGNARAMQWADIAERETNAIRQQLHKVLAGQKDFPQLTIQSMESAGWITSSQSRFLRDRRVHFTPFSGTDAEGLLVLLVEVKKGFLTSDALLTITKGSLTVAD